MSISIRQNTQKANCVDRSKNKDQSVKSSNLKVYLQFSLMALNNSHITEIKKTGRSRFFFVPFYNRALALVYIQEIALCVACIKLTGTTNFAVLTNHFMPVSQPACGAAESKDNGEHVQWNTDGSKDDA